MLFIDAENSSKLRALNELEKKKERKNSSFIPAIGKIYFTSCQQNLTESIG